jgi:hypothetical protein
MLPLSMYLGFLPPGGVKANIAAADKPMTRTFMKFFISYRF